MSSSTPTVDPASSVIRAMVTVTLVFLLGLGAIVITAVSVKGNSGAAGGSGAATTTAKIGLKEYSVTGTMTAPAGHVILIVTNEGTMTHNLTVTGKGGPPMLPPGQSARLTLDLAAGTYQIYCSVPGHKDSGMQATFRQRPPMNWRSTIAVFSPSCEALIAET